MTDQWNPLSELEELEFKEEIFYSRIFVGEV